MEDSEVQSSSHRMGKWLATLVAFYLILHAVVLLLSNLAMESGACPWNVRDRRSIVLNLDSATGSAPTIFAIGASGLQNVFEQRERARPLFGGARISSVTPGGALAPEQVRFLDFITQATGEGRLGADLYVIGVSYYSFHPGAGEGPLPNELARWPLLFANPLIDLELAVRLLPAYRKLIAPYLAAACVQRHLVVEGKPAEQGLTPEQRWELQSSRRRAGMGTVGPEYFVPKAGMFMERVAARIARGARIVVVDLPEASAVRAWPEYAQYRHEVSQRLQASGIPYIDMADALSDLQFEDPDHVSDSLGALAVLALRLQEMGISVPKPR